MTGAVDIHALVGAYALDAVDDLERVAFERHLRDCPACSAEVAELRETATRLAGPVAEAPPPRLRGAVLAQIASTPQERIRPAPAQRREPGRWRTWVASAAAAVLFAGGVSTGTWALTRQHYASSASIDAVLAAADAHLVSQEVEGGRITMVVSPSHNAGVALLSGLRKPDGAYQLWMVDPAASAYRPVGLTEAGSGRFYIEGLEPAFGLSKEPKGGSTTGTPTEIVGKLNLR
ncbi:anti-sigma factor [Dactylosporangium sp. McL0621]|uniref:anti-sigma factor n=1 Tax=Dactylosporangium sp. McL0621 TaxID=3415678 RepID=UPI003CFB4C4E